MASPPVVPTIRAPTNARSVAQTLAAESDVPYAQGDLVIDQAETTNHRAQTIRIPGALFIRSQTDMPSCPV